MDRPSSIEVYYDRDDGTPVLAVGGAYGGLTPDGSSVIAHVYLEHGSVPSIQTMDIDESGQIIDGSVEGVSRGNITRVIQATLVMSPTVALSLGAFLIDKASKSPHAAKAEE